MSPPVWDNQNRWRHDLCATMKSFFSSLFVLWTLPAYANFTTIQVAAPISPRALPNGVSFPTITASTLVYPGCPVPPTTFGHTWYIDPVNGHGQVAYGADPGGGTGSSSAPWNSLQALFGAKNTQGTLVPSNGYTQMLLASVNQGYAAGPIQPGDEVILMNGNYGEITAGTYSVPSAQIINSPAVTIAAGPSQTPVLAALAMKGASGFVFNGLTIQSQNTDGAYLVSIVDGYNPGYANTNIVLENMNISSAPISTALTWTPTQWKANARPGVFIQAITAANSMTCASVVNSKISVTHLASSGALQLDAISSLANGNEISYFSNSGLEFSGDNTAIYNNYIHDQFNTAEGDGLSAIIVSQQTSYTSHQNAYIARNKVIHNLDPALPAPAQLDGILSANTSWTNFSVIDNIMALSGCYAISPGNVTNGVVANNSIIDGGITSLEPCGPDQILVTQAHAGGTGSFGKPPFNVRIFNNIAPTFAYFGLNVQADHNIATNTSTSKVSLSYWDMHNYAQFIFPTPGSVVAGPAASGANNWMDGIGQGNNFTTVPTAGSIPMSPTPNWILLSGSPAKTYGGATLIPPITDYNGNPFLPPYSIGAIN